MTIFDDMPDYVVLHPGALCTCGPGFCWRRAGTGGYGVAGDCDRLRTAAVEVCPHCAAPGQGVDDAGRALCWNCAEYHEPPYRLRPNPYPGETLEEEAVRRAADAASGAQQARAWIASGRPDWSGGSADRIRFAGEDYPAEGDDS